MTKTSSYNVTAYGATGVAYAAEKLTLTNFQFKWLKYKQGSQATVYRAKEGEPLDSVGIQLAMDTAHQDGGGTVVVPAGDYLIGPIEFRSNVILHLEPGARLWGSPDMADYDLLPGETMPVYTLAKGNNRESEGLTRDNRRLLSAHQASDFGITGSGYISAQSPAFVIPWMNSHPSDLLSLYRPQDTLLFYQCQNVLLEGFHLRNTPAWSVVLDSCKGVRIDGIDLHCFDVINSDGIDLVNTSDTTIANCRIHCTDDAICLKNTLRGVTMSNITVTNCVLRTLCNGFKIGTDSAGNFEDITVSNLVMHGDESTVGDRGGVNLNALDGGTVRNINISNLVMRNFFSPFYLYATDRSGQQKALGLETKPGRMERISITNVLADGTRYPCYVVGHADSKIQDLHIANINIRKSKDFYDQAPEAPVPEVPNEYPTPFTFGSRDGGDQLPACGLYVRNAEALVIDDFKQRNEQKDGRDLIVTERCEDIEISRSLCRNPSA
ncbi:glycosyl hydrolase family 28 protein [Kiritimatiellota bacterium B12222]|nr:glycosyl hydrolase family 28 protein [Kiritimatiellota bacterium B12222]